MFNMMRADIYKLSNMWAAKICILVSTACALLIAYMLHGVFEGTVTLDAGGAFALISDTMVVVILGAIITGILICGSFESKNIHDEIACGNGRLAIVLTKTVSILLFMILLTLPFMLMATIGFASEMGFGQYAGVPSAFFNILSNVAGVEVTDANILKSAALGGLIILTYLAKISICIPVAFKARKSIVVIIVGFVTTFVFDILGALTKDVSGFEVLEYLPYSMVYKLTLDCSAEVMIQSAVSSILFIVLMLVYTYLGFRKSEIK